MVHWLPFALQFNLYNADIVTVMVNFVPSLQLRTLLLAVFNSTFGLVSASIGNILKACSYLYMPLVNLLIESMVE